MSIESNSSSNSLRLPSNLTLSQFNTLLEENKPYNRDYFKNKEQSLVIKDKDLDLVYLIDIKLIVCSICKNALKPTKEFILEHFKSKHLTSLKNPNNKSKLNLYKDYRDKIEEFIKDKEINTFKELLSIKHNTYIYKDLPIEYNAFKCLLCNYITTNYKTIKRHLNNKHNFKNSTNIPITNIIKDIPIYLIKGYIAGNNIIRFIPKIASLELEQISNSSSTNKSLANYKEILSSKVKASKIGRAHV